jgi:hypothetical protein
MTLIVETGAVVPNANSYTSLIDARAKALTLGVTLPVDDDEAEIAIIMGTEYVDAKNYSGARVSIDQSLDWPRTGAYANGFLIPDDAIPVSVINASIIAAANAAKLWVNDNGERVQTKRVEGAVTKTLFNNTSDSKNTLKVTRADALLKPYLANGGSLTGFMGVV